MLKPFQSMDVEKKHAEKYADFVNYIAYGILKGIKYSALLHPKIVMLQTYIPELEESWKINNQWYTLEHINNAAWVLIVKLNTVVLSGPVKIPKLPNRQMYQN